MQRRVTRFAGQSTSRVGRDVGTYVPPWVPQGMYLKIWELRLKTTRSGHPCEVRTWLVPIGGQDSSSYGKGPPGPGPWRSAVPRGT